MNMDKKLTNIDLAKQVCKLNQLPAHVNPIQDGHFRGCSRMGGRAKRLPFRKICHTYPTMMRLARVIP